jgi:hypothetical protein
MWKYRPILSLIDLAVTSSAMSRVGRNIGLTDSRDELEDIELEERITSEDHEPLLPTIVGAGHAKVEIGRWPLACLLLQHLSRYVSLTL